MSRVSAVEGLGSGEDRGDRRAELVRDVRDEVASQRLETTNVGDVEEHGQHAAAALLKGRAADEEPARLEPPELHFSGARSLRRPRTVEQLLQLGMAHDFEERLSDDVRAQEQHGAQRGIHQRDLAFLVEEEDAFLHSVEDAGDEVAFGAELGHRPREARRELIEHRAYLTDILFGRDAHARIEIAFVHSACSVGERPHRRFRPAHRELREHERADRSADYGDDDRGGRPRRIRPQDRERRPHDDGDDYPDRNEETDAKPPANQPAAPSGLSAKR
jgi:hypothetical protein